MFIDVIKLSCRADITSRLHTMCQTFAALSGHKLSINLLLFFAEPNHSRAQNNKDYYIKMINDEANSRNHHDSDSTTSTSIDYLPQGDPVNQRPMDSYRLSHEYQTYEKLCRGEETHVNVTLT